MNVTETEIRKEFFWSTSRDDVRDFVDGFIDCLSTTGSNKVPRTFGPELHGT